MELFGMSPEFWEGVLIGAVMMFFMYTLRRKR